MKVEIDLNSKHYDPKIEYKNETGLDDIYPYRREL